MELRSQLWSECFDDVNQLSGDKKKIRSAKIKYKNP